MDHAEHLVDLVDESGNVVGGKPRRYINKSVDLYHTVFVILRTADDTFILSMIPDRKDLPNLYARKIGATVATIRRHNETPNNAGMRAVRAELLIDDAQLKHLGDTYLTSPGGHRNYMSVFSCIHSTPDDFSYKDIESLILLAKAI